MVRNTSNGSANEIDKSNLNSEKEKLVEIKSIPETPFTAVRAGEKWFLALGRYRLTQPLEDEQACIENAKDVSWDRIVQVMRIISEEVILENTEKAQAAILKEIHKEANDLPIKEQKPYMKKRAKQVIN